MSTTHGSGEHIRRVYVHCTICRVYNHIWGRVRHKFYIRIYILHMNMYNIYLLRLCVHNDLFYAIMYKSTFLYICTMCEIHLHTTYYIGSGSGSSAGGLRPQEHTYLCTYNQKGHRHIMWVCVSVPIYCMQVRIYHTYN